MSEPMHLVLRDDILMMMQLLQDSGAVVDTLEHMALYERLDAITGKPPYNIAKT